MVFRSRTPRGQTSPPLAAAETDRLIARARRTLAQDRKSNELLPDASACLSALFEAERFGELVAFADPRQRKRNRGRL